MRTLKERQKYFDELNRRGFDPKEIIKLVPDDELQTYAMRGSELAKSEIKRRDAMANLHPLTTDRDLDIGV